MTTRLFARVQFFVPLRMLFPTSMHVPANPEGLHPGYVISFLPLCPRIALIISQSTTVFPSLGIGLHPFRANLVSGLLIYGSRVRWQIGIHRYYPLGSFSRS